MNEQLPAVGIGSPDTLPAWTYFNAEFTEKLPVANLAQASEPGSISARNRHLSLQGTN
jgi:hypothetical protein